MGNNTERDYRNILINVNADKDTLNIFRDQHELRFIYSSIVQEELRSLSFYHLNPEALRKRSSTSAPPYLAP